ncbi:uncharacterized protein BX663DRAFT_526836 [Cokeromyces recurvatus]|uniref:uncharacterized protein n=1 Tax=Cokeromyces recurvatus TaxID=90255 RepID=UPI0022200F17|nr:uncharacterized protein BX663DRAFT_526836 [Cokeromyces recurvatus]KAI7897894.1 hypothetical protein BX663DRAFT_526836 [Cokeromyces recurvatus]
MTLITHSYLWSIKVSSAIHIKYSLININTRFKLVHLLVCFPCKYYFPTNLQNLFECFSTKNPILFLKTK